MIFDKNWRLEREEKKKIKENKARLDQVLFFDKEAKRYLDKMLYYGDYAVITPFYTPPEIDIRIFDLMLKKGYIFIGYVFSGHLYFIKQSQVGVKNEKERY